MQDPLFPGALPYRPSFGERRLNSDLARFSLDLSLVRTGPQKTAHSGPYPSPPMSESPHTSGYPSLSSTGHPEVGDTRREGNLRPQEWDQRQQPPSSIIEAVNPPPQFLPPLHPETFAAAQGQVPVSMTAQRSPFAAQAAFPTPKAPKRPKAHVLSACVNCKKAHLSCDVQRPCRRCIATNKEHSCVDVQHKKRGRPRLRDGPVPRYEAFGTNVINPQTLAAPLRSPIPSPVGAQPSYRSGPHRVLKSQTVPQPTTPRHLDHASLRDANIVPPNSHGSVGFRPSTPERRAHSPILAAAFLNMDFVIAKASNVFIDLVSPGVRDLVGRNLFDMIRTTDREKLYRLKRQMQEERDVREPAYLPPIYGESEIQAIQSVHEPDIISVTLGSHDRIEDLTFRLPDGRYSRFQVQLKLAKTSVFFAVLVLPNWSYQPEFQPPPPQIGQYRQPMVPSTYGQTTPLPLYCQSPQAQPYPTGEPEAQPPYYNQRSLGPVGPPSGDPRLQTQSDSGYRQTVQYSSASPAPSHLTESSATLKGSTTLQKPRALYASPREGPPHGLQLPPIRGVTGPGDSPAVEASVERDVRTGGLGEQQEGGRKYKRDRIAVQEMLE